MTILIYWRQIFIIDKCVKKKKKIKKKDFEEAEQGYIQMIKNQAITITKLEGDLN